MAGVSRAHITQELRPGGVLEGASAGTLVDVDHPTVVAWLKSRGVDPTAPASPPPKPAKNKKAAPTAPTPSAPNSSPERSGIEDSGQATEPAKWLGYTLTELVRRFGGEPQFSNWLKAVQTIEDIRRKRLDNEETERSIISRDLVERSLLGLLEEQNQKLLNELPRTLARTIQTLVRSGQGLEASERETRKLVGQVLSATAKKMSKGLKKTKRSGTK